MLRLSYKYYQKDSYRVKDNLGDLLQRLKKGMQLTGRIIDCLEGNMYLLRVWGYNILTESEESFEQFEEIKLIVKEVNPHLVFHLFHDRQIPEGFHSSRQKSILV